MIKLENLTKQFSQKQGQTFKAVDNVNLNVPESDALKKAFANPTDSGDPAKYK